MKTSKTNLKSAALLAGVLVSGTATSFGMNQTSADLLHYATLGSGAEVRSELIKLNDVSNGLKSENSQTLFKLIEQTCGEGKCGEGKCGESKADTEKKEKKSDKKADEKAEKTDEAKCGEGKSGEAKSDSEVKSED